MSTNMSLHSIVCIKSVVTDVPQGTASRSADNSELNPFDRPALETAFRLREDIGGKVTVISMGPESSAFVLYEAMAMGADKGVLVCDSKLAGSDTLVTSTVLAGAVRKLAPFDLLLFGSRTTDSDTGHVGPQTSVLLDIPMVTGVLGTEQKENGLFVDRAIDGYMERFELDYPASLTINHKFVEARDIGLSGIREVYEKEDVEKWTLADLGLSDREVGEAGSPTRVLSLSRAGKNRECRFLNGSMNEQVEELIGMLEGDGLIK